MEAVEHCALSKTRPKSTTLKEIAMAVEMIILLLERGRGVSDCAGRDSLESLRRLDTWFSFKGIMDAFVLEVEADDMKRAMKGRKKKKLTPSMSSKTIEDCTGRASSDQPVPGRISALPT